MAGPWAEPVNDPVLSALILRRTNVVVVFFYHVYFKRNVESSIQEKVMPLSLLL